MKNFVLYFVFILLFQFNVEALIENFNQVNFNNFKTTENITLSLSSSVYVSAPSSVLIKRNIKYDPSPNVMWTEGNEVIYNFPSPCDFSEDEYLIFYYYDEENFKTGAGTSILQVGLFDGDEWWYSTQTVQIGLNQMCIPLKALSVTNDSYIDGFCIPSWEKNDPQYKGDGIFNKGNIQKFKISFGAAHNITGNFYLDDLKAVPLVNKSIPVDNAFISKNLSSIKIYFGGEVVKATVENNTNVILFNNTTSSTVLKSLSFDTNKNILTLNGFTLADNNSYTIILTNIFFKGLRRADTKRINFTTTYPKSSSIYSNVLIQDYSDGFYFLIFKDSVSGNISFSIANSSQKFDSLKAKTISPQNVKFKNNCEIVFFVDGNYDNYKILQNKDGEYKKIPCYFNRERGYVKGVIDSSGEYLLLPDDGTIYRDAIISVKPLSNPFTPNNDGKNDIVKFNYTISLGGLLTVKIYNSAGVPVRTIVKDKIVSAGSYSDIYWDGRNDNGNYVSDGIYIYRFILKRGIVSEEGATTEYYVWYENAPEESEFKGVIGVIK